MPNVSKSLQLAAMAAGLAVAGCHGPVSEPPDFIKHAMAGEYEAQARLAACYGRGAACIGVRSDPALSCAWRAVIVASASPQRSLADVDAYRAACDTQDESLRQRAGVAAEDLFRRIYHTGMPPLEPVLDAKSHRVLYPSAETVRRRIGASLADQHQHALPQFGPQNLSGAASGNLQWRSCTETVCLNVTSPVVGGGLISYRVSAIGPNSTAVAARLAAAGLDAPGLAAELQSEASSKIDIGPVCWSRTGANDRATSVNAELGPCRKS